MARNVFTQKSFPNSIEDSLIRGFLKTDSKFLDKGESGGTTAVVAVYAPNSVLYVANAGDSRAVLCEKGVARALSVDHKVI